MIWQLFVAVTIIYVLMLRWKARHRIKFSKLYKNSVKSLPILGHSYFFMKCKNDNGKILFSNYCLIIYA